jgi:hypothetical protein
MICPPSIVCSPAKQVLPAKQASLAKLVLALVLGLLFASCTRTLGYGVLLWTAEGSGIPSGTVLPVYIRSNIDQVWVAGIPKAYRREGDQVTKVEIPLALLDLHGSKSAAQKQAGAFAEFARTYAETLQDGLPVRENPDNGARRVYRLRAGEIIKVLSRAEGIPAISASGAPLPGGWYRVLTEDGSRGYCFSYRLKLFEHSGGPLQSALAAAEESREKARDTDLENLLSKTWVAESYSTMLGQWKLDIDSLLEGWGFSPGEDTGIAHVFLPQTDLSFPYQAIRSTGTRSWQFDGAPLQMRLRSDTVLAVQWNEAGGSERTALFVDLPVPLADLVVQETSRRETLFAALFAQGPIFSSANYGTLAFTETGGFVWSGFQRLVPQVIPQAALGAGSIEMRLFLAPALENRYDGAFSLVFNVVSGQKPAVSFMYTLDTVSGGLRLEYVPPANIGEVTVTRRAASPMIIYFYRDE